MQKEQTGSADRRSLYTKNLIKGSLLELLKTHSFTSISVTMLSETAGIGRNTFYRHFGNTFEALVASIDDALAEIFAVFNYVGIDSDGRFDKMVAAFCEYILSSDRYRIVFTDSELASIIIDRIIALDSNRFARALMPHGPFTQSQAEALIRFQAAGCLELCNRFAHANREDWQSALAALDSYSTRV